LSGGGKRQVIENAGGLGSAEGRYMTGSSKYKIMIYNRPGYFFARGKGLKRYRTEMAYLAELTGNPFDPDSIAKRVPGPSQDAFMLDDEQLAAYSAFRKQLDRQFE
jgi:hypothetical protein